MYYDLYKFMKEHCDVDFNTSVNNGVLVLDVHLELVLPDFIAEYFSSNS